MDTTTETRPTEVVHYCDYAWDGQAHLICCRGWVTPSHTDKILLARGYQRGGAKLYTQDRSKATCPQCLAGSKN